MWSALAFMASLAAFGFALYLFKNWPAAKRAMFDAHVDDALAVVRDDPSYWLHPAVKEAAIRRLGDEAEQWLKERSS